MPIRNFISFSSWFASPLGPFHRLVGAADAVLTRPRVKKLPAAVPGHEAGYEAGYEATPS
ncbi:hypothetical protein GCM10011574_50270 [Microbispora bryophytorum]|uniref:Uncharacterized protein n=1 Tax=Microbispora bryophytorum TaxID=1460882 RepID=A0A8H9H7K0_9ACTN|nr:hypothetical protein GCM10011574_50270 [Microbispora bryophytorum]